MSLLKTIEDQTIFNFTGKVNLLEKSNGRFVGSVFLYEGNIVNSYFKKHQGQEALLCLTVYDQLHVDDCLYIVEPEIIGPNQKNFSLSLRDLKKKSSIFYTKFTEAQSLRPPSHLRIRVSPDFIKSGKGLDGSEYKLLQSICDFSLISDIYSVADLPEYLVLMCLVSLRKKQALKVCQNK